MLHTDAVSKSVYARIMGKVVRTTSGCMLWTGARSDGYGFIRLGSRGVDRRVERVHRTMWMLHFGQIESGMEITHSCGRRNCVEPSHLLKMAHAEVVERGDTGAHNRAVRQCPHGHEYTEENTRQRKDGRRVCRACERMRRKQ